MKRIALFACIEVLGLLGSYTQSTFAATIGFETSEGYATAPAAAFTTGPTANPAPFTGNSNGWSQSISNSLGALITTSTSGHYVGGQALSTTNNSNGTSYIGAINLGLTTGFTTYTFDIGTQAEASAPGAFVAGWADAGSTSTTYAQPETGPGGGLRDNLFVIRDYGMQGNVYSSGVTATVGHFYRATIGLNFAANTVTLDVINLTSGSAAVDLNGATAGNTFTATGVNFNGVNPSTYTGVVARATGFGVVDNIVVPEPSSALLGATGMLSLVGLRRRKRDNSV